MTNLDEKKLDEFVNKKMESEAAKYHGWGTSARQAYIYGYTQAVADQQKKIEKLEKAVELMRLHLQKIDNCTESWTLSAEIEETLAQVDKLLKGARSNDTQT